MFSKQVFLQIFIKYIDSYKKKKRLKIKMDAQTAAGHTKLHFLLANTNARASVRGKL